MTQSFQVRIADSTISVSSAHAEAFALLERYVYPSAPRRRGAAPGAELSAAIVWRNSEFDLVANSAVLASAANAIDLIPTLIHALDDAVVERLTTLHAVHAGAVVLHGRALLFPGSTHSGKSSLVAQMLRRGAAYCSDEYALLDAEGRVHAYPRPLLARDTHGVQTPLTAEDCGATTADAPAPVGWLIALDYRRDGEWSLAPMEQSLALLTLLKNTPHALADRPQLVPALERAVAHARCYTGKRGEAGFAAEEILALVAEAPELPETGQG